MSSQEIKSESLGEEVHGVHNELNDEIMDRAGNSSNICFDYEDENKIPPIKLEIKQDIKTELLEEKAEGLHQELNDDVMERAEDFSNICFDYEDRNKIPPIKEEIKQEIKTEPLDEDNINVETHSSEEDQEKRDLQAMVDKLLIEKQNLQVENQIWKSEKTNEERQLEKEVRKLQVENQNLKEQLELSVLNSHKNEDKHLVEAAKKFKKSDFAQNLENPESNNKEPGVIEDIIIAKDLEARSITATPPPSSSTSANRNVRALRSKVQVISKSNEKSNFDEKSKKKLLLKRQISQEIAQNKKSHIKNVKISQKKPLNQSQRSEHECVICGKHFGRKQELKRHIYTVHEKQRNYKCENCGNAFQTEYNLRVHVESIHEEIRNYKCDDCGKAFHKKSNMKSHIETMHQKILYKCEFCDKKFTRKYRKEKHEKNIHK